MLNLFSDNAFRESEDDIDVVALADSPPLDMTDEIIVLLAKVIVIGAAVAFYDELAGLLILLAVALGLVYEQRCVSDAEIGVDS
ncbi:hypothetical protein EYC98_11900 [Halieaceae bacterium IMCC14734]|uniref:Uncharacterized protein n=1 Tax=Candidatus Litorirhabdus singularis TaxID=2518993 RepID=A0ABT3TGW5_9GAMM|nr:hypothetical protein [Candidatus Litorirhabdus singularis]MCX2981565.1 hypothetical protein [Candidatus Litorirhabdus singularis]